MSYQVPPNGGAGPSPAPFVAADGASTRQLREGDPPSRIVCHGSPERGTGILQVPEPVRGLGAWFGVDNGITGAVACLTWDGAVYCAPVAFQDLGREKLLDIEANLALLQQMIAKAGMTPDQVLVVYEQAQIIPKFGVRNSYTNGRHNEFWRVLLSMAKIPFRWVNPKDWQHALFSGVRGTDTKAMADLVRRQRFPHLDLSGYNKSQRGGITDALCIALWAKETCR